MIDVADLIRRVERSNRLYHTAGNVLGVAIIVVLLFVTLLTINTNQQLRRQLQQNHEQSQREADHTQKIIEEVQHQHEMQTAYIRCIAVAFSTGGHISDLDSCQVVTGTGSTVTGPTAQQKPAEAHPIAQPTPRPVQPPLAASSPQASPQPTPVSLLSPKPSPLVQQIIKAVNAIIGL